jgi:hypothetical protein
MLDFRIEHFFVTLVELADILSDQVKALVYHRDVSLLVACKLVFILYFALERSLILRLCVASDLRNHLQAQNLGVQLVGSKIVQRLVKMTSNVFNHQVGLLLLVQLGL